jgi:hypothetical protein
MSATPFLTEIDTRAAIHGSRDALSLIPIWASFGRLVVGNVTTASTSLRGFTTLLLGYYFAERVVEHTATDQRVLDVFLKFEQLVNYSRAFVNRDADFRGSERVQKRLSVSSRVLLSADQRHQILGDQRTYGLWGLYSVASRTSGLLEADRPALTPVATAFVEREYVARMTRPGSKGDEVIVRLLAPKTKELDLATGAKDIAHILASLHSTRVTAAERAFYQESLVDGGREQSSAGSQPQLAKLLDRLTNPEFGFADLRRLERQAQKDGLDVLGDRLASIGRLERVIVPAANLFGFLLRCDGRAIREVAADIGASWTGGLKGLERGVVDAVVEEVGRISNVPEIAGHLGQFARCASEDRWSGAIESLIDLNGFVMTRRGGASWIGIERGRVVVRYGDEGEDLERPKELQNPWRNTYFINSLYGIKRELEEL